MKVLNTNELVSILGDPNLQIIDARSSDAYNGWRFFNEQRGGHIIKAKSLPAKWCYYIDWPDILDSKKIRSSNRVVVYGYNYDDTLKVATSFLKAGFSEVDVYHGFIEEWSADPNLPMDFLERYQNLVSAKWLQRLISTGETWEYHNTKYVICHAHYRNRRDYEEGHIPGAIDLDTNELESPITWNRRSPEELKAVFESKGITFDTSVILYGKFSFPSEEDMFPGSSAGHLAAFRSAFIMLYAGIKDVRILNGGLQSWIDEGFSLSRDEARIEFVSDFGKEIPARPELAIDLAEAKKVLKDPDKNLVCVRSQREYSGEVSGYNYIKRKGRIPGAVFSNCGSDAYHMENFRNLDHTMREFHEVKRDWSRVGILPEKYNSFYCGTGWRGSEAFFNAWLMGWPSISVFDGGWFEWSNNENNPVESGIPVDF